jgi:hypothetical protein
MKRKKRELEVTPLSQRLSCFRFKLNFKAEMRATNPAQQRLRVCETCGAQLNILDHESRLADHYGGKMHLGMIDIREKYEEMKVYIYSRKINDFT